MMKTYLSILAILLVLPCTNTCSAQVADSATVVKTLNKCWRAFSHEYATIYGLEEEEIKTYSKQRVCFANDSISMYTNVLYDPKYAVKKVKADNYAKSNFDCGRRKLGIMVDSVYQITITSVSKPSKGGAVFKMTDVIAFDGQCIYVVVDGVIFKLIDADAKAQPTSSN